MENPILRRGDRGDAVLRLQSLLNRVGSMLQPDGDFGPATERGVRYAQDVGAIAVSGVADPPLWGWLRERPEPFPALDTDGVAFIALEETGGLAFYDSHTRWPHYPGEASGVTIGVGYDLRFNTEEDLRATWGGHLPSPVLDTLAEDIGRRGTKRRVRELREAGIEVPFKAAWPVFVEKTLPRYHRDTASIYPTLPALPGPCRSALVSLVFNRGTALNGDSRREMKAIRDILAAAAEPGLDPAEVRRRLGGVEDQILSMKRLWSAGSGLIRRRQAEANLWRSGMAAMRS